MAAAVRAGMFAVLHTYSPPRPVPQNMRRIARELGEGLSEDEMAAMIEEFDQDGDGAITEEDFTYIMKQTSVF